MFGPSQAPAASQTNPLAIAALVCGIVSFAGLPLGPIAAIICGHIALRQIRRTGEGGQGLAKAGLILGYASLVIVALVLLIGLVGWSGSSGGAGSGSG